MKKRLNRQLRNKIIMIILITLFFIILYIIIINNNATIQRKLIGTWNVEIDSCIILNREWDWCGNWITVQNESKCSLPSIFEDNFDEMQKNATGTWKIINTKPDSIFFNVPKNPLHGKYAVKFYRGVTILNKFGYKMKLSNDSTLLICSKGSTIFNDDARNWEN